VNVNDLHSQPARLPCYRSEVTGVPRSMRNAMYYDGVRCNSSGDWLLLSKLVVAAFGGFMKRLFAISALLLAFTLPSVAQGIRLSLSDQKRFDSYYSRWQEYRRT